MRKNLIYDLPTRIFHWLFAGLFLISFIIGKSVDDDSLAFSYHMLSGFILLGLVLWRVLWGLWGSKYARFSGFALKPGLLKEYFLGILSGSKKRWSGHNPASSWAAIIMFALVLGLATTGYLMSTGYKEAFEEVHEFFANTFIVIVLMHIAGVVLHSLRHRDNIGLSMLDGKKELSHSEASIPSSNPIHAMILVALVAGSSFYLIKNFDSQNRTLKLFGQTLTLGENEDEFEGDEQGHESKMLKHEDDEDDD